MRGFFALTSYKCRKRDSTINASQIPYFSFIWVHILKVQGQYLQANATGGQGTAYVNAGNTLADYALNLQAAKNSHYGRQYALRKQWKGVFSGGEITAYADLGAQAFLGADLVGVSR